VDTSNLPLSGPVTTAPNGQLVNLFWDDLEPIQLPVRVMGKPYVLVEADEDAAVKYRNASMKAARLDDGKIVGFDKVGDVEPLLVSLCLYYAGHDGKAPLDALGDFDRTKLVPLKKVLMWPARIVKPLFDRVKDISQLEERPTKEVLLKRLEDTLQQLRSLDEGSAKNWLESTASTSDSPTS